LKLETLNLKQIFKAKSFSFSVKNNGQILKKNYIRIAFSSWHSDLP